MIPIKPEPGAREYYVRNIMSVWAMASEDEYREGREWYPQAHTIALMLADGDLRMGAGLLAADAFDAGVATRHTRDSCSKANRILRGADPVDVLPMERKTGQFYRCIVNPSDEAAVCVDRHAYDICVGVPLGDWDRGLSAHGRYRLVADCYRDAADRVQNLPSVVQAVTWVAWRRMIAGLGTRGARV